jgi:formylglycine-generating enzyme required for sulfatase activity
VVVRPEITVHRPFAHAGLAENMNGRSQAASMAPMNIPSRNPEPAKCSWLIALALCAALSTPATAQRNLVPAAVDLRVPGQPSQRLYAESHALVIGASNYRAGWSRLPGVSTDVAAVSRLLEQQGFQVTQVMDPTRDQLDAALRNFAAGPGQGPDNRLLVYFAGHGHTLTSNAGSKLGYIVPVDAPRPDRDPRGFRRLAYSMESVQVVARQIESRHALFLFDSCFSGTIFRSRSGVPDNISDKTSRPVRQFITAGDADQVVPDESIFRKQLEAALRDGDADLNRDGYITGTELGSFLEDTVTNYSHRTQTPRWGKINDPDLDKGDFVFARGPAPAPVAPPPAPAPRLVHGQVIRDCPDCPEMVVVGTGSFLMGSPAGEAGREGDEGPQRQVRVTRAFALGRTEVTVGEFGRFVEASKYVTEAERNVGKEGCWAFNDADGKWDWRSGRSWKSPGFEQSERHPVVCVSFNDVQAYVQWLSRQTGQTYRLPSEAEWEYAARAGSTTSRPWADNADEACRHGNVGDQSKSPTGRTWTTKHECNDGHWYTAPVGSYAANGWGLKDMLGNVWEWVQDCYDEKSYAGKAPNDGSAYEVAGCSSRALRGGSWYVEPAGARSAFRYGGTAGSRDGNIGFRLARMLP